MFNAGRFINISFRTFLLELSNFLYKDIPFYTGVFHLFLFRERLIVLRDSGTRSNFQISHKRHYFMTLMIYYGQVCSLWKTMWYIYTVIGKQVFDCELLNSYRARRQYWTFTCLVILGVCAREIAAFIAHTESVSVENNARISLALYRNTNS